MLAYEQNEEQMLYGYLIRQKGLNLIQNPFMIKIQTINFI